MFTSLHFTTGITGALKPLPGSGVMVKEQVTTETQGEETAGLMTHQQGTCTSKVSLNFQALFKSQDGT